MGTDGDVDEDKGEVAKMEIVEGNQISLFGGGT